MRRLLALAPLLLAAAAAQPDVVATAETDRAVYAYGEPIVLRYTLDNRGTEAYETMTSSSCAVGLTFGPYALPEACTADEVPFVLEPGARVQYEWTLDPADLGFPEADGEHTLWAHVEVSWGVDPANARLAASTTFEAPAYRGGPLAVGFDAADEDDVDALRDDIGADVAETSTLPDGLVIQQWQVTGAVLPEALRRLWDSGLVRFAERAPRPVPMRATSRTGDPLGARISPPAPNPTAGRAALTVRLAATADVTVEVADALGRRVAVLHEGPLAGGVDHRLVVAEGLPAGVYVVRVVGGEGGLSRRLVVAR